jgi:hypothetical protein
VRIGERKVKGEKPRTMAPTAENRIYGKRTLATTATVGGNADGTESLPAYSCAVSCPCGRYWIQPSGGSPSECECGRISEWVCPVAELDEQSGFLATSGTAKLGKRIERHGNGTSVTYSPRGPATSESYSVEGGASRFFPSFGYYAKASGRTDDEGVPRGERHAGCEELYWRANKDNPFGFDRVTFEVWQMLETTARARGNVHPTVKGIEMMMYLIKLSGGDKIGDLCFGSGGTAIAAQLLGLDYEGAELCPEAVEITRARLAYWNTLSLSALHGLMLAQPIQTILKVNEKSRMLGASRAKHQSLTDLHAEYMAKLLPMAAE